MPPFPAAALLTRTRSTVNASALRSSTSRFTRIMFTRFSTDETAMSTSKIKTRMSSGCISAASKSERMQRHSTSDTTLHLYRLYYYIITVTEK